MAGQNAPADRLIAEVFQAEFNQPLDGAGGGRPAWRATDHSGQRGGLMAVAADPGLPLRSAELQAFIAGPVNGVLSPVAHGVGPMPDGRRAPFVICQAPAGRPLRPAGAATTTPWDETRLLYSLLRPAAQALEGLRQLRVTHRAIRPDNLFQVESSDPVVLGCAWAAPPGMYQSALYEPPYSAMCLPGGRGAGVIADDVYALAVTMIVLALGREPMAGMSPEEIVRRKLERGSFTALVGDQRLPPAVQDVVRGMLAEDPDHRPPPALLSDIEVARARRVATRPPRRAQRPLDIGTEVWGARTLAHAIFEAPEAGAQLLRGGRVDQWVRRSLGDSALAAKLEEVVRPRAGAGDPSAADDALLSMRAIAILDPLAPLCWNGIALWPDGLGAALTSAEAAGPAGKEVVTAVTEIVAAEATGTWASLRADRMDAPSARLDAHSHRVSLRQRGWGGGLQRLRYGLNPTLACQSPRVIAACALRLNDLLPALEAGADGGPAIPIDADIAAFIAARGELSLEREFGVLGDASRAAEHPLAALRVLATLQARTHAPPVPRLAQRLAGDLKPALSVFQSRHRREQREDALGAIAGAGRLAAMLVLFDDPAALAQDRVERDAAAARLAAIDGQLGRIAIDSPRRRATARRLGHEVVRAVGAVALLLAALLAALT